MNTTQQMQNIAVVLCDDHSHGELEKILKEKWSPKEVPVHTGWENVLPADGAQPAVTHCLVVAVMSALRDETLQNAVEGIKALLAKGCKAGMVLVEPFAFEETGVKMQVRLLESLGGCKMDFVETRSMEAFSNASDEPKTFSEFFDAVYADILGATEKAVAENWGEVFM